MCETAATSVPTEIDRFQAFLSDDDLQSEAVLSHMLGVTRHEARAYRALHNRGETTAQELAEYLDRHPSNVYEGLDGLCEIGLATRRRRVPDHGGKEYVFASVPIEDAVQIIRNEFEEWVTQMRGELDTLESACNGYTSIFKTVEYIVLGGFLIGFYGFREQFMEWFWSGGFVIPGLLGAPIVLGAAFYFLLLFLLFNLAVWFYRTILWG